MLGDAAASPFLCKPLKGLGAESMGRLSEAVNGYQGSRPSYLNSATRVRGGSSGPAVAVQAEVDEESFNQVIEALSRLMVSHPDTKKSIKRMLANEAKKVRNNITKDVRANIDNDPRSVYQAVKRSLYKKILGFNVSILDAKKGSVKSMRLYHPVRKLDSTPHQRGGNRIKRSNATKARDGYFGKGRAFVLRFYNSGTQMRQTRFGNRGAMPSRRVFATSAVFQTQGAMDEISQMIEEIMNNEFNK